ncbi:DUF2860 family protein [Vibrio sp. E150_011]
MPRSHWMIIAFISSTLTIPTYAALRDTSGFSGELSLSNAIIGEKSNLVASNDPAITSTTEAHDEFWLPLGTLRYTYGTQLDKEWFIGSSRNDIAVGTFILEGGYRQQLPDTSVMTFSYLPTVIGEPIWSNPYVESSQLKAAEATGDAFRFQYENIAGTPFTLDMAYGNRVIDEERSAYNLTNVYAKDFNRNSDLYYAKGSYTLSATEQWTLFPSLIYLNDDSQGSSLRNQGVGTELTTLFIYDQHSFAATLSYMNHEYKGQNTIFEQSRRIDEKYSGFFAYEYLSLWNIDTLSLISLSGYNATDSSIAFYDSSDWITSIGMNFSF